MTDYEQKAKEWLDKGVDDSEHVGEFTGYIKENLPKLLGNIAEKQRAQDAEIARGFQIVSDEDTMPIENVDINEHTRRIAKAIEKRY